MRPKDIQVGKTYVNRGKGQTARTVLRIVTDGSLKPFWWSSGPRPSEAVVEYSQVGRKLDCLYISSFARWCGRELPGE